MKWKQKQPIYSCTWCQSQHESITSFCQESDSFFTTAINIDMFKLGFVFVFVFEPRCHAGLDVSASFSFFFSFFSFFLSFFLPLFSLGLIRPSSLVQAVVSMIQQIHHNQLLTFCIVWLWYNEYLCRWQVQPLIVGNKTNTWFGRGWCTLKTQGFSRHTINSKSCTYIYIYTSGNSCYTYIWLQPHERCFLLFSTFNFSNIPHIYPNPGPVHQDNVPFKFYESLNGIPDILWEFTFGAVPADLSLYHVTPHENLGTCSTQVWNPVRGLVQHLALSD